MTTRHRLHIVRSSIMAALFAATASVGLTATTASAAPSCALTWGSLPKEASLSVPSDPTISSALVNVRSGRHACYDRLVLDVRSGGAAASATYVSTVFNDPRGDVVQLRGGARLQIVVHSPTNDINTGNSTYSPAVPGELTSVTGYRTFRQVASAGSFEGQSNIGLGVRARLPFRVFVLAGPGTGSRVVIDVAHRW
ncbi:hypothetical protein [Lapillicoccus sp.]|uniref:AMIN-like domain-containing (lipo)protein n=1 Tax=Lapillicoccus sp. TaxID=1909287 RepID=UPI003983C018